MQNHKRSITHSHVPRTIVVKLFNKISLVLRHRCRYSAVPDPLPVVRDPVPAQIRSKRGRGLEVHVPTGTPATSVLRQHYVAQSPVLVLRAVWGSRGRGGPYNRVRVSRQSARCIVSPL